MNVTSGSPKSGKKPGPNEKCTCGSGAKAKKCCFSATATAPPPVTEKGNVLPGSVDDLLPMAREETKNGNDAKAMHLYTMAINSVARKMRIDKDGKAPDEDLLECNKSTGGKLAEMLAERSRLHLKKGDTSSAAEDAETSSRADPKCEVGYLRLLEAYEASRQSLQLCLEVCERGVENCPDSEGLVAAKWRFKKAIADKPAEQTSNTQSDPVNAVEETRRLADDRADPRHVSAAADWGSLLATGAHGVQKDVAMAEKYLRIGADGGDVVAQRNLGLLLLELQRPGEAAEELNRAANAGDEEAANVLHHLAGEAEVKRKDALAKLEELAATGDPRARAILEEMLAQGVA